MLGMSLKQKFISESYTKVKLYFLKFY